VREHKGATGDLLIFAPPASDFWR